MLYGRPRGPGACRSCGGETHRFDRLSTAYVYLLGLYLGDGTISKARRGVFKLRVFLDMKYPDIVAECEAAMLAVLPFNRVSRILKPSNCYEVYAYSKSWPCLFPQHGPEIRGIFCDTCDLLGLHWTMARPHTIYVSRKDDVARLDEFVGPKS